MIANEGGGAVGKIRLGSAMALAAFLACSSARADNTPWPPLACGVGDQQGLPSCTGWAVGYYVKSMMEAKQRGSVVCANPAHLFSPSWIYNQIQAKGATLDQAGALVDACGAATLQTMAYDPTGAALPTAAAQAEAAGYRNVRHWSIAPASAANPAGAWGLFLGDVKGQLAKGPVVFEIFVSSDFLNFGPRGNRPADCYVKPRHWKPKKGEPKHALTCIDWDDTKFNGAFRFVNSWGTGWGDGGYAWISYADLNGMTGQVWCFEDYDPAKPPLDAAGKPLDLSKAAPECATLTAPPTFEAATVSVRVGAEAVVRGPWVAVYPGHPVHAGAAGVTEAVAPAPPSQGRPPAPASGLVRVGVEEIDAERIGAVRHVYRYRADRKGDYDVTVTASRPNRTVVASRRVRVTVTD
jgi:hypothetical protein